MRQPLFNIEKYIFCSENRNFLQKIWTLQKSILLLHSIS